MIRRGEVPVDAQACGEMQATLLSRRRDLILG